MLVHQCYTLSRDGNQYLDSTNSVLKIQQHDECVATTMQSSAMDVELTSPRDLSTGDDKGVRFHFPTLENGWVVCEVR